jgi:hypothetical protein
MPETTGTDLMMIVVQASQEDNAMLMEFAATNTQATLAYLQNLAAAAGLRAIQSDVRYQRH